MCVFGHINVRQKAAKTQQQLTMCNLFKIKYVPNTLENINIHREPRVDASCCLCHTCVRLIVVSRYFIIFQTLRNSLAFWSPMSCQRVPDKCCQRGAGSIKRPQSVDLGKRERGKPSVRPPPKIVIENRPRVCSPYETLYGAQVNP